MFTSFLPKKSTEVGKNENRRPKEDQCRQQLLPAWRPILTVKSVYPLFLVVGFVYVPLGVFFFLTAADVNEVIVQYTHCKDAITNAMCSEEVKKPEYYNNFLSCNCTVNFSISTDLEGQVYAYYGLTNFYQNYRHYVRSRDDKQLEGVLSDAELQEYCEPFRYKVVKEQQHRYAPCGIIANSIFNDTFTLIYKGPKGLENILTNMTSKGIAWPTDVSHKYGKPDHWNNTLKPVNWPKTAYERNPEGYANDEELLVWMRNAALPTFRKLHRLIMHDAGTPFARGLPAGQYALNVNYAFPVTAFDGTKRFILTTKNWLGGKNNTLGIAYIVVGIVHILMAVMLIIMAHVTSKQDDRLRTAVD